MIGVVGCNHGIQPRDPDWLGGDAPQAVDQKRHFAALLERIIKDFHVDFVGEEWGQPDITAACDLAKKYGATWSNINTSRGDLEQLGVPLDYVNGPYTSEQKKAWHREREHAMIANIRRNKADAQTF